MLCESDIGQHASGENTLHGDRFHNFPVSRFNYPSERAITVPTITPAQAPDNTKTEPHSRK